jgi:hypothetical protein
MESKTAQNRYNIVFKAFMFGHPIGESKVVDNLEDGRFVKVCILEFESTHFNHALTEGYDTLWESCMTINELFEYADNCSQKDLDALAMFNTLQELKPKRELKP